MFVNDCIYCFEEIYFSRSSLRNLLYFPFPLKPNLLRSHFHSSSDLLRLLASLPTVVRVDLKHVRVARVSDSVTLRPGKQARRLQSVRTDEDCSPPGLSFVVQSLAWQALRELPEQRALSFCGLSRAEQALVGRTSERLGQKGFALYHNNVMDRNGEACEYSAYLLHAPS